MVNIRNHWFEYSRIRFIISDFSNNLACYFTNSNREYHNPNKILSFKEMTNKSFIIAHILNNIYINNKELKGVRSLQHISGCIYKREAFSFSQNDLNKFNEYLDKHYHGISMEERYRGSGEWLYVFKFNKTWNTKYRKDCIALWKIQGKL